jgi:hypothetical protein
MKVVYEDSIIKRIQSAVYDADSAGRRIGYIEVTVREANELSDHVRRHFYVTPKAHLQACAFMHYTSADAGKLVGHFYSTEIRVEMLP